LKSDGDSDDPGLRSPRLRQRTLPYPTGCWSPILCTPKTHPGRPAHANDAQQA